MMKKRILASSMASVMALSSISVVAFADEKNYGEAVSKAELQAFVDGEQSFVETKLDSYGSVQGEKYQAALDHCTMVLNDTKADASDYSAAYQMAKAVKAKLAIYTADQLKALIKENQAKYDQNNIMNEELQDLIYKEDTFADFVSAFDDAQNYVDSGDSRLITDAYIALEDAVKGLSELASVSKADFRAALKAYEAVRYEMKNYESWRRGKFTVKATETDSDKWGDLLKCNVTLADVETILFGASTGDFKYWNNTSWKTVALDAATWFGGEDFVFTTDIYTSINNQYTRFDEVKAAVETSDKEIVAACNAALDAVKVFDGWEVDNYKSGSKSSCATLERKYHSQMVSMYLTSDVANLATAIDTANGGTATHDADKATLKSNKSFAIVKDKTTGYMVGTTVYADATAAQVGIADPATQVVQKISANTNVLTYVPFDSSMVVTTDDYDTALKTALENYENYLAVDWKNDTGAFSIADAQTLMGTNVTPGLADGKTIPGVKGSTAEWTIIWRQLAYAMEDRFPVAKETTYTLAQLKEMIDRAYDIAEKTGDSAVFAEVHQPVVDERQAAIEFYTAAKATTGYKTDMIVLGTDLETVYKDLKSDVETLEKWLKDYLYSYEEIRTLIGETAIAIDNGDIKSDAVVKALANAAYDLSVLEASETNNAEDNNAFDEERKFQPVNRLKTDKQKQSYKPNDFEKNLKKTYEALVKAVDEAKKGTADAGVKNDFDGDGKFGASDLTAILDAYTASSTDKKYDANGDGSFGVADLTFVLEAFTAQA